MALGVPNVAIVTGEGHVRRRDRDHHANAS